MMVFCRLTFCAIGQMFSNSLMYGTASKRP
ncbi:MAG: hypothetical protein K2G21_10950 [Muribaculaceae bacterium]|nr:hypothetical protein [Muribaculaceae bacterium]